MPISTQLPFKNKCQHLIPQYHTALLKFWQAARVAVPSVSAEDSDTSTIQLLPRVHQPAVPEVPPVILQHDNHNNDNVALEHNDQQEANSDVNPAPVGNVHPMTTRLKSDIQKPNTRYVLLASKFVSDTPKTITTAMKHPGWSEAVLDGIRRLHLLKTWTLVPETLDMKVLDSRWLYKEKLNPDGTLDKHKVRLVAKGNEQKKGVDYLETFSPVVRTTTIRLVLKVATTKQWPIKQLDVSNAFQHGDLNEPVYMYQPSGFVDPEIPDHVCCLTKALYSLKHATKVVVRYLQ